MSKYRPGTMDDAIAVSRRQRRTRRLATEANVPSGSAVYQTTDKVKGLDVGMPELSARVDRVAADVSANAAKLSGIEDGANRTTVVANVAEGVADPPSAAAVFRAIAEAVAGIAEVEFVVADELPAEGKSLTFYFVPRKDPEDDDRMDEYVYVGGQWEHVGSPKVKLPIADVGKPGVVEPDGETIHATERGKISAWVPDIGFCQLTTGDPPSAPGTWTLKCKTQMPMSGDPTIYSLYERTA